jgi:hypothetical protein
MKPPQTQSNWADAWILLSIIYASGESGRGRATLRDLIAAADFIQHAILNYGEADEGLARLIEAGHVIRDKRGFRATKKVMAAYRVFSKRSRRVSEQEQELARFLDAKAYESNYCPPVDSSGLVISREEFEVAAQGYLSQFRHHK